MYLKQHDQVLFIEASGLAHPLASNTVYEEYERSNPVYLKYMRSKSYVLFQMMENILGSAEIMKLFIRRLLGVHKTRDVDSDLFDDSVLANSISIRSMSTASTLSDTSDDFALALDLTPRNGKDVDYHSLADPTVFDILRSRGYNFSDIGTVLRSLQSDLAVNSISTNTFFDRWMFNTGVLSLRVAAAVDAGTRSTTLVMDQVSYKGSIASSFYEDKVCIYLLESDKTNTEPMKAISKGTVTHYLPFQAKIIKRVFKIIYYFSQIYPPPPEI